MQTTIASPSTEYFAPLGAIRNAGSTMVQSSAAGYDTLVVGIDEASARSVLAGMQDRLVRDPALALGLAANASVDDVRAAFLQLTKQYHPVRFGRMALDIQRLSNEVFLALRAAHDALAKTARRQSGQIPIARAPTPKSSQFPSQPPPSPSPPPSSVAAPPPNARTTQQLPTVAPPNARTTQQLPTVAPPNARTTQQLPTVAPPSARSTQQYPAVRPADLGSSNDSGERPPVQPRTKTPATGVNVIPSRPSGSQPVVRPPSPVRQTGNQQVVVPRDEAIVLDLLQRQQWDQARSALHQLMARDPSSKRIRALMSYARGREAQLDRRIDDARVELQDALELDPDLQPAKTALTELFTRRK